MAVDSECSIGVPVLKFPSFSRDDTLLVSAIIELDLLTLKLVRIIARGICNLLTNFDVSGTFRFRVMGQVGQHLSDAPRDIATLTFDFAGDGPSRRYRSSSSICTPSLKFEAFWFGKYDALPVSALLGIVTLKLVRIIARGVHNFPTNIGVSRTFSFST